MTGEGEVAPWPILLRRRLAQKVGISHRWAVLWVVLGGLFTTGFTITLLVVSLEGIAEQLATDSHVLTWAITGPMLAFGVVGPAFGKAGDLWGHKRIFVGGLFFAAVFALASALAWNAATLILFRTLSATAGSACGPSAMAYINRMFEPAERVKPLSYWSFVTAGSQGSGHKGVGSQGSGLRAELLTAVECFLTVDQCWLSGRVPLHDRLSGLRA